MSVKHSNEIDKASAHSIRTHDNKNDMMEDIPANKKKEAMDDVKDIQNIENDDHETMGRYEKTNSKSESAISIRNSVQVYIDELQSTKTRMTKTKLNTCTLVTVIQTVIQTVNARIKLVELRWPWALFGDVFYFFKMNVVCGAHFS